MASVGLAHRRGGPWLAVTAAGLCLAFAAELALSVRQLSETFDEPCHIYAGYRYLTAGDFGVNPEHPPLVKLIAALPVASLHPNTPPQAPSTVPGACAAAGVMLLRSSDARLILLRARYAAGLFGILLAILLFVAVREMFGAGPALFALSLAVFEPNLLANGALVTTDMAVTGMLFGTVYAFWRFTERPTVPRMLASGAAAGLTLASKHSGMIVFPILLALGTVEWLKPKPDGFLAMRRLRTRAGILLAALLVNMVVALVVLWAFYEFRYRARPAPLSLSLPISALLAGVSPRFAAKMLLGATNLHLLPEAYLFGLAGVLLVSQGRPSFLLGKWTAVGSWHYFPLTFLIKSTAPFLALLVIAVVVCLTVKCPARRSTRFLALPATIYVLVSLTSRLNIGHRHLLPVYPFLIAIAAAAAWELAQRRKVWIAVAGALLTFHIGSSLRSFPNYLPYSNELWGGTSQTYKVLSDSSVDWGQGLVQTAAYLRLRDIHDCYLAYFGLGNPSYYGVPCKILPGMMRPFVHSLISPACDASESEIEGTLVIGASAMSGTFNGPPERNPYWQFLHVLPAANIGGSMLVFRGRYQLGGAAAFCHLLLANRLLVQNKPEQAADEARKAINLNPYDVQAHILLADALGKSKRAAAAKTEYLTAMTLTQTLEPPQREQIRAMLESRIAEISTSEKKASPGDDTMQR